MFIFRHPYIIWILIDWAQGSSFLFCVASNFLQILQIDSRLC